MGLKKYQQEEFLYIGLEEKLDRARRGLLSFTKVTKSDYEINWHHVALAKILNKWLRKEIRFLIVEMPPRHGKSELVSRRLPALIHGLYPNDELMAASYSASLANEMTAAVQQIMDTPEYRMLFPESMIIPPGTKHPTARRNSDEHDLIFFDKEKGEFVKRRGKYRGQGVGGSFTGKGANWIIVDDPIKGREAADSATFREKLWNFYTSDLRSRLEKGGQVLITMTRWHEDDLVGRLKAKMKSDPNADQFEIFSLPAIKEDNTNSLDKRKIGQALWPNKYDVKDLKAIEANNSRDWNALYQQRPSAEQGVILKRTWMQNRYKVLPREFDKVILSADLRFKDDKESGDYVVIDVWGRIGSRKYFIDQVRGRWGFNESVKNFTDLCKKYPRAAQKLVENKANGPALENVLKSKISGIVLVEPDGGKIARAHAVEHQWEAGDVWLPDESIFPGINDIISEWVGFPYAKFDDRVDTMTQALIKLEEGVKNALAGLTNM